jgi:hypothetical protein
MRRRRSKTLVHSTTYITHHKDTIAALLTRARDRVLTPLIVCMSAAAHFRWGGPALSVLLLARPLTCDIDVPQHGRVRSQRHLVSTACRAAMASSESASTAPTWQARRACWIDATRIGARTQQSWRRRHRQMRSRKVAAVQQPRSRGVGAEAFTTASTSPRGLAWATSPCHEPDAIATGCVGDR